MQLRQDNALGTLYNMVGFQTKLKHAEQVRLFRTIPGLENAEFARLGGLHRNTYLNSPRLLDATLRLKAAPQPALRGPDHRLRRLCRERRDRPARGPLRRGRSGSGDALHAPPATTALGALLNHITGGHIVTIDNGPPSFQPMNVNFGLFPPIEAAREAADGKRLRGPEKAVARKRALTSRAKAELETWLGESALAAAE